MNKKGGVKKPDFFTPPFLCFLFCGSIINVGVTNNRALQKNKKIVEHIEKIL